MLIYSRMDIHMIEMFPLSLFSKSNHYIKRCLPFIHLWHIRQVQKTMLSYRRQNWMLVPVTLRTSFRKQVLWF